MRKIKLLLIMCCTLFIMSSNCYAGVNTKYYKEELSDKHIPLIGIRYHLNNTFMPVSKKNYTLYSDGLVEYYEMEVWEEKENVTYFQIPIETLKDIENNIMSGKYKATYSQPMEDGQWDRQIYDENGECIDKCSYLIYKDVIDIFENYYNNIKKTDRVTLNKNIKIKYNGAYQAFSNVKGDTVYPISYNGTTYLPIRAISSMFGSAIEWNAEENAIYLGKGEKDTKCSSVIDKFISGKDEIIDVEINSEIKILYGNEQQLFKDANKNLVYPLSYQGTTYLPVRAISNLFDANIEWIGSKNEIEIMFEEDSEYEKLAQNSMFVDGSGVCINKAGEKLKRISLAVETKSGGGPAGDCAIMYSKSKDNNQIYTEYDVSFDYYWNGYDKIEGVPEDTNYILKMNGRNVDYYKFSEDGMKLISLLRGKDFDYIQIEDYTVEEFAKETYNQESKFTGKYEIKGEKVFIAQQSKDDNLVICNGINKYCFVKNSSINSLSQADLKNFLFEKEKNSLLKKELIENMYIYDGYEFEEALIEYKDGKLTHVYVEKDASGKISCKEVELKKKGQFPIELQKFYSTDNERFLEYEDARIY